MTAGRLIVAAAIVAGLVAPRAARAEDVAVGLYAPSAPFGGTSARQDYVSRLAAHLAAATDGKGVGRVYARASDFTAAVKAGEIDVAVVDATWLAAAGTPYTVLATATRGGDDATAWQLVSRGGEARLLDLKGKQLLCPSVGGRESDFVYHALLGGELAKGFFGDLDASPDAASAVAAVGLGRADAAVVPVGVDLPAGVARVTTLPPSPWPVLVAFGGTGDALRKKIAAAAPGFDGGDVLGGFTAGGGDAVKALARRFGKAERRGPMVTLNLRVTVDELVEGRRLAIPRIDVRSLVVPPAPLPKPGS